MPSYSLRVNGSVQTFDSADPDKPLLYVLRGAGLTATKFGCGLGQCGAYGTFGRQGRALLRYDHRGRRR